MTKVHSKSQQIGNRGVAQLARYCSRHNPVIIFRQTPNDDIGLDGEMELIDPEGNALGVCFLAAAKFEFKNIIYHA